ncbi:hypothetical protein KIN20_033929 [Parelaphostrongylus tenuis]|uniref:Uncharacterized protein n=1 Tax=Parelaphostrongylus tenuis TaxID=148309 RepID=A0AAD5RBH8_PARTN|nr:hypothetical protein KIN20_033929 [Parelaphostrongylus tenuis]
MLETLVQHSLEVHGFGIYAEEMKKSNDIVGLEGNQLKFNQPAWNFESKQGN